MNKYVIRRRDEKFFAGPGHWSAEYPDAQIFSSWKEAAQEAMDSTPIEKGPTEVIGDFGTDAERVVLIVNSSILGEEARDRQPRAIRRA